MSAQGFATLEPLVNQHVAERLKSYAAEQGWRVARTSAQHQWFGESPAPCLGRLSLHAEPSDALARQRTSVKCANPSWQISVISEPSLWVTAVFATQSLERGQTLSAQNIGLRELEVKRSGRDFFNDTQDVAGLAAKRRIRTGQLLSPSLLGKAKWVSRGEPVKIIASQHGISASTQGQALSDGAQDEIIRVRNNASEKVIDAKVISPGEVSSLY